MAAVALHRVSVCMSRTLLLPLVRSERHYCGTVVVHTPPALEQTHTWCQTRQCIKQKREGAFRYGKGQTPWYVHDT